MFEPYVARLRSPHFPTRWYVLKDDPNALPLHGIVALDGFGPYPTQTAAEAAAARLATGGPAFEAATD